MFFIFKSNVILHIFVVLLPIFNSYPIFNKPDQKHTNFLSLNNNLQTPFMDETIEEVRQLWEQDSNLPRLTRGEIQELYEKVKREDFDTTKKIRELTRSEGVRALMLVLPYNTDNKTKENLQDLYTRPPVTKVINIYAQPQPIKFVTPDPSTVIKNEIPSMLNLAATTYKPNFSLKNVIVTTSPSTYHPPTQPVIKNLSSIRTESSAFQPITNSTAFTDYNTKYFKSNLKSTHRYSSHYNAKDTEFSKLPIQMNTKPFINTVKPVFEVLKTLSIVDQKHGYHQPLIDDIYQAESAPKPVVSSFTVKNHQSATQKIRSDAYLNFKPLNIGEEIRIKPEVEGYLTRFGIVGGRQLKDLNKKSYMSGSDKQASEKREVVAQVANREGNKSKKSTLINNTELEKLIQNLQELERLNNNANSLTTSSPTSTQATLRLSNVLTINGESSLNEPSKLRRRIDPNIDANNNRQIENNKSDELAKLLENLQELEKLRISPQNALQLVGPTNKTVNLFNRSDAIITQTSLPIKSQTITNRFNDLILEQQNQQQTQSPKLSQNLEMQQLVTEFESIEKPTVQPKLQQPRTRANFSQTDFLQLQKLLGNESELKRLYEQVRFRSTPKTTTTTTVTFPIKKHMSPNQNDLQLLQKYLAELNRESYTTEAQTTSTTTLTTLPSSIITTSKPSANRNNYSILMSQKPNTASGTDDLQKLIGRIQQLESFNIQPNEKQSTELPPYFDFISRNVKAEATANDYHVPINDFAQLQQLYKQAHYEDQAPFDKAEIPTALTAPGFHEELKTPNETNESESESSLQKVDPNEFIQLQKLLSKVQELERVKLKTDGSEAKVIPTPIRTKSQRDANLVSNMLTVVSTPFINATKISNSHTVYPEKLNSSKYLGDLFFKEADLEDLKLNFSNHEVLFEPNIVQNTSLVWKQTTNEKMRELDHASFTNPDKSKYTHHMDAETESNKYIHSSTADKTITKQIPKFISIPKQEEYDKIKTSNIKQDSSEALQKLLNNAQRLENLSIILPKKLSEQLETKLTESNSRETMLQKFPVYTYSANTTGTNISNLTKSFNLDMSSKEELYSMKQKTVVFSLTTMKSPLPKLPKTTTESTVQLPIFSATKIIEDAIKLAANKIGVSTEHPQGFRRRSDVYDSKTTLKDSDLIGEFSDIHYQIAIPDINHELKEKSTEIFAEQKESDSVKQNIFERKIKKSEDIKKETTTPEAKKSDLSELQRLVNNLQELKNLNINITSDMIKQLDENYLEEFKHIHSINDDQKKSRRQSEVISTYTTSDQQAGRIESYSTKNINEDITAGPIKFNFGLSFNDSDRDAIILTSNKDILSKSSPVSTTEESQSSSLADLEDSFGPDPNKEKTLPPKKKNGFYFLADWNSFLEVGDGDDQVVVKLDPKIGDPRLFLPIKVP